MRKSSIERKTAETEVSLDLDLDGTGKGSIDTGIGFLDHMLTLFCAHSRFDLNVRCAGDTQVDFHHSTEDIAICLGKAFSEAIGDMRGIRRYADTLLPMDEALVMCAVDISGRAFLCCKLELPSPKVGDFDSELCEEFLTAFVREAGVTLHVRQLDGKNTHHIIEACFKALGRTLAAACETDPKRAGEIPSTKGVL